MKKTISIFIAMLISLSLFSTIPVYAHVADENSAVSRNFKRIGKSMRKLRRINDSAILVAELENFRAIALKNQHEKPSFTEPGTELLEKYQSEVKDFIGTIDSLIKKVESGEITSGREIVSILKEVKDASHDTMELEEH